MIHEQPPLVRQRIIIGVYSVKQLCDISDEKYTQKVCDVIVHT